MSTDAEPDRLAPLTPPAPIGLRGVWVVAARCFAPTLRRAVAPTLLRGILHVQAQTCAHHQGAVCIQDPFEGGRQRSAHGASEFEAGAGAGTACGPSGATIATVTRSTGWQPHTVRAFLAAVVRKKLGLRLESEKTDGERVYRIVAREASGDATSVPSG